MNTNDSFRKILSKAIFFFFIENGGRNMRELEMNPYVVQIDKFVDSLGKLSRFFLSLEDRKPLFFEVEEREASEDMKERMWEQKMSLNREGCAVQLDAFAQMIQHSTHELNASIFEDEHLEKKLKTKLAKIGVKLLSTVFFVTENGRYEIHVTVKAQKGRCVETKELARIISKCTGRQMVPETKERLAVGNEYCTITCIEGPLFHTLQGVAKIGKGCECISGDNFSMLELPGGKQGIILSDGMGAGESAHRESSMVVEILEELLGAGFPKDTAFQMLNTALVIGREEVRFSTIDASIFDLYTGKCEIAKAGASTTFIKRGNQIEGIRSTSLPLGVVAKLEVEQVELELEDGDMVIMVTDGVLDALPVGEQDLLMKMIIEGTHSQNPKEVAHHILEQVLACSGEVPLDDMTVLVVSIWSLEK